MEIPANTSVGFVWMWMKTSPSSGARASRSHGHESGQTILLVAVALAALFGLAALAIDVTTLYIAHSEAQKAADSGALAGAKAFVSTGFTSGGLGAPSSGVAQSLACNGSSGFADLQATAEANQNQIARGAPTSVTTVCDFSTPENPRITVTVVRTGLPLFFSRIWGSRVAQVTAVARAEAYNPSGQPVPIEVTSVKPWLVANCDPDPSHLSPHNSACNLSPSGTGAYFIDPATNYAVANSGSFIGKTITLKQILPIIPPLPLPPPIPLLNPPLNTYYDLQYTAISTASVACPSAGAAWGTCTNLNAGTPGYYETVACANSIPVRCGPIATQGLAIDPLGGGIFHPPNADEAVQCLIHAGDYGPGQGQDVFNNPGTPVTIDGASNNPNPALRTANNISRSDSVVTVPIGDCPLGTLGCNLSPPVIVGFMQLGIKRVIFPSLPAPGNIEAVILNVSGCGAAGAVPPVSGGGVSPVPVRLIQ